jgi:hypothetical protein
MAIDVEPKNTARRRAESPAQTARRSGPAPEFLFAAGHMISLFYYRTNVAEEAAEQCLKKFLRLKPNG